jgi:hypothetical protein
VVITGAKADKTAIASAGKGGPFYFVGLISYAKPILPPLPSIFYFSVTNCPFIAHLSPS